MSGVCRFCPELAGEVRSSEFHAVTEGRVPVRYVRQTDNFAVFPALGHIVPGHVLLTTKRHWLSMAQIVPGLFDELEGLLAATRSRLMHLYGGDVLVYEHGQVSPENQCGACVDHAHLHLVPISSPVDERVRRRLSEAHTAQEIALFEELPALAARGEGYLLLQDARGRRTYYDAPTVPSQYLRKLTCEAMGLDHRWDWRANVEQDTPDGTVTLVREVMSKLGGDGWGNVGGALDMARTVDGLTGAHNRSFLLEYLEREVARSARHQRPLSLVLFDVDALRRVNETRGHYAGDLVLQKLASRVRGQIRREEVLVRYGGEEFVVVLPETERDAAVRFAERLQSLVASQEVDVMGEPVRLTISVGVAAGRGADLDVDRLLDQAADHLDRAKQSGGNCIVG
ncbi:MAG TPA: diguanylate cyclase [Kofleriaceae bacterium]|nr:diguanylate cyclase [Kofleriaceae bacterium]